MRVAYEGAVAITPTDYEAHLGLAGALGALGQNELEVEAYENALRLRPTDGPTYINLGIALSGLEGEGADARAEGAFRQAVALAPADARAPLNLGRYLAKLSRPAEAIATFYTAAATDAEYFEEVKLGVGTARAQQGRLRDAIDNFASASRMRPSDEALKTSLVEMEVKAAQVEAAAKAAPNAVADLCGTPCQDVVDGSGTAACAVTWAEGCGDAPPPSGFGAHSTVAELCSASCAFYRMQERERAEARGGEGAASV